MRCDSNDSHSTAEHWQHYVTDVGWTLLVARRFSDSVGMFRDVGKWCWGQVVSAFIFREILGTSGVFLSVCVCEYCSQLVLKGFLPAYLPALRYTQDGKLVLRYTCSTSEMHLGVWFLFDLRWLFTIKRLPGTSTTLSPFLSVNTLSRLGHDSLCFVLFQETQRRWC